MFLADVDYFDFVHDSSFIDLIVPLGYSEYRPMSMKQLCIKYNQPVDRYRPFCDIIRGMDKKTGKFTTKIRKHLRKQFAKEKHQTTFLNELIEKEFKSKEQ